MARTCSASWRCGLRGVAPGVTFHAYRVWPDDVRRRDEAMERAHRDGADVVNISIGAALQWFCIRPPRQPIGWFAAASSSSRPPATTDAGARSSAPGIGRDVIGAASFDNTFANLVAFSVSPDGALSGYIAGRSAAALTPGSLPMSKTNDDDR